MPEKITKQQCDFASANGKDTVIGYFYEDTTVEPKAVIQLSHGMCEYIGRYDDFAEYLCHNGYAVCGNDHLGHGATSDGSSGVDGYFGEKDGHEHILRDLRTMNEKAHKRFPHLPVILLGHSMGSFYARAYAARWPGTIDGLIISGTGGPNPLGGVGLLLTNIIGAIKGKQYRSAFVNKMAFGTYLKKIEAPATGYDWITRDKDIVSAYAADPKCTFVFTVGGFHELMTILKKVSSPQWAEKLDKKTPILMISGDMDPVGDYGDGVKKVHGWLQQAGIQDLTLHLYPGARHEVLNETNRAEVYADVLAWLEKHWCSKV